ncbi:DUF7344 domain-containing protein [Halorussus caseinilyticus]|uniref:DUF7344 domain-containing protein n=1 Tax=Halorussus caseinilyticus TaxID=3034025 RepID=A0ABD5WGB3_9EURY|nr:hypothetical protein [Halorussus sp. DT72]
MSQAPNNSTGEETTNAPPEDRRGSCVRSLDEIFETLAAERRRNALYVLYRRAEGITLSELAEEIAGAEDADAERVATSLHHVHLPKLADVGVADYDPAAETVRLATDSEPFRRYLTAAEDERRPLRRGSDSATLSEF